MKRSLVSAVAAAALALAAVVGATTAAGATLVSLVGFDLTPFAALLSGHDTFEIRPAAGLGDAGALDYSQLSVTLGPAATVAEPSGAALAGLALAALAASARWRGVGVGGR